MADRSPVDIFLQRVAAFGLSGAEAQLLDVPSAAWDAVVSWLSWNRLTGIAMAAMSEGILRLSDGQRRVLLEHHQGAMVHALTLERRLLALADVFDEAGLEFIVLKGPAVAHSMFPDPSWRPFGDLDILVRTSDWRRACSLLPEQGFLRRFPEPRPGFVERFGHTAAHKSDQGLEVDLHRTLVAGAFGLWLEPEKLFEHTAVFRVGGRALLRLDDSALMMHACIHASLGHRPPLLMPVRDVAQIAANGDVDRGTLAEWARRWKLTAVLHHASETVARLLGVPPIEVLGFASEPPGPPRRETRALEAYTTDRRERGGKALSSIRAIRGVRGRIAYVAALLFPTRDFLVARSQGAAPASLGRRWATPLRWLLRRVALWDSGREERRERRKTFDPRHG